ncbi:hypothetical protein [Pontibacter ummariensis]|nr:hypothetical protein [Pontibacter ummariensis]
MTNLLTHVFLSSSTDELPVRAATDAVTKLIRIYGEDMQGSTDLDVQDITAIENGEYWLGKTWHLNKAHGLQDFDNSAEQNAYSVTVSMNADEGFNLSIIGYNRLLKMFS